jgi:hypothetical protein
MLALFILCVVYIGIVVYVGMAILNRWFVKAVTFYN